MSGKIRKAINFDLDTNALKQVYCKIDAIYRAKEAGQFIELDNFMKGVIYGYSDEEKNISKGFDKITFVSESSYRRDEEKRICNNDMSKMQNDSRSDYERE